MKYRQKIEWRSIGDQRVPFAVDDERYPLDYTIDKKEVQMHDRTVVVDVPPRDVYRDNKLYERRSKYTPHVGAKQIRKQHRKD
jgi:hypothetical protein